MFIKSQPLSGEKRKNIMNKHSNKFNSHFLFSTVLGLGKTNKYFSTLAASILAFPLTLFIMWASRKLADVIIEDAIYSLYALVGLIFTIITAFAIHSSGVYSKQIKIKDPGEVVIDEVLGQTLCLILTWPLTFALLMSGKISYTLAAFILPIILFRLFDSVKPWPIKAIERLKGGFGIVLDDLAAGFLAALIYYAIVFSTTML